MGGHVETRRVWTRLSIPLPLLTLTTCLLRATVAVRTMGARLTKAPAGASSPSITRPLETMVGCPVGRRGASVSERLIQDRDVNHDDTPNAGATSRKSMGRPGVGVDRKG